MTAGCGVREVPFGGMLWKGGFRIEDMKTT